MESESGTTNTKISDSGYSNNCSNSHSNSQRSASSKSRHSGSNSSRSSGYCGGGTTNPNGSVSTAPQQPPKRNKDKEHKKKLKPGCSSSGLVEPAPSFVVEATTETFAEPPKSETMGIETQQPQTVETAVSDAENRPESTPNPPVEIVPSFPVIAETEQSSPNWNDVRTADPIEETVALQKLTYPAEYSRVPSGQQPEDGFCCVISMYDGVVLYTTPSLTNALGFPKDMWLGRSFIDFVHPKDRKTFSTQVSTGVAIPLVDYQGKHKDVKNCLYVCLRKYRGLKSSGFGVVERAVSYQAFQLTVTFRHNADTPETKQLVSNRGMFLVVVAVPVYSAYKFPDERVKTNKFGMRHTAACVFNHVDPDVVTNFGFMPQDMLGKSVFDFYHPEDMPFLKEAYKSVIKVCQIAGSVFRSKPYRFAVQNGGFAMIETEWSSFVNPWSRRLEFVIGLHRVLQGPANPDVFDKNKDEVVVSDETMKESKHIQGEILLLLNEELPRPSEAARQEVSKRCKNLANFMETLMAEVNKKTNLQLDLPLNHGSTVSVSEKNEERDSVMLGEISPHHDYYDSKSPSETPPSYNQLNFNENIERFFQSKPKTTVSDESNNHSNNDTDQEGKNVPDCPSNNQKCLSPIQNSGTSGSGSAGNLSSGSNPNIESGSSTYMSNDSYKPPHLTESLLSRHNEDMEKIMLKRYKHHRFVSKERETKKSHQKIEKTMNVGKANMDIGEPGNYAHGVKRSGSHSWEDDGHRMSKQKHQGVQKQGFNVPDKYVNAQGHPSTTNMAAASNQYKSKPNDVNLWPPFSVNVTPMSTTQPCTMATGQGGGYGMFPVYYIPQQPIAPPRYPVPYMPGMLYNYGALYPAPSPLLCSPLPVMPVMPVPLAPSALAPADGRPVMDAPVNVGAGNTGRSVAVPMQADSNGRALFQRPSSQATSVKAEPGSAVGSAASASLANKALSECSRKDLALQSVCSPGSPVVSPPHGEADMENFNAHNKINANIARNIHQTSNVYPRKVVYEESSNSSSYSSFLKTDTTSGSNDDTSSKHNSSIFQDKRKGCFPARKKDPPWVESVSVSPDLIYRYQVAVRDVEEILKADLDTLKEISQPVMVNDQLNQLYVEMELAGLSKKLTLEEGFTSSSSSGEDNRANISKPKKKRRSYSSLMMIFEEDAPFPPPHD